MGEVYGKLIELSYSSLGKFTPFKAWNYYRELIANQYRSVEELRRVQWTKFQCILNHAYQQVPFYRDHFGQSGIRPKDIRKPSDLHLLPITTREQLVAAFPTETVAADYTQRRLFTIQTSGTTSGEPFRLLLDFDGLNRKYALLLRNYSLFKWRFGRKIMALWNRNHEDYLPIGKRSLAKALLYWLAHRKRWLPPFRESSRLTEEEGLAYWSRIKRFQPYLVEGDAFTLYHIGKFLSESNLGPPPVQAVSSSASASTAGVRRRIEGWWRAPVYNNYGPHEMEGVACECEERQGLHQSIDAYLIEFISDGQPAAEGELSELVLTDLDNHAMPLIRYRIGDLVRAGTYACSCGRTLPLMHDIEGRSEDALVTGKGFISENEVQDRLAAIGLANRFQVIQQSNREFTLRLVGQPPLSEKTQVSAEQSLRSLLEEDAVIRIERIEAIPCEPSGKFRLVKSDVQ